MSEIVEETLVRGWKQWEKATEERDSEKLGELFDNDRVGAVEYVGKLINTYIWNSNVATDLQFICAHQKAPLEFKKRCLRIAISFAADDGKSDAFHTIIDHIPPGNVADLLYDILHTRTGTNVHLPGLICAIARQIDTNKIHEYKFTCDACFTLVSRKDSYCLGLLLDGVILS